MKKRIEKLVQHLKDNAATASGIKGEIPYCTGWFEQEALTGSQTYTSKDLSILFNEIWNIQRNGVIQYAEANENYEAGGIGQGENTAFSV